MRDVLGFFGVPPVAPGLFCELQILVPNPRNAYPHMRHSATSALLVGAGNSSHPADAGPTLCYIGDVVLLRHYH